MKNEIYYHMSVNFTVVRLRHVQLISVEESVSYILERVLNTPAKNFVFDQNKTAGFDLVLII